MSSQSQKSAGSQSRRAERKAAAKKSKRRNALSMFAGALIVALSIVATLFVITRPGSSLPAVKAAAELPPDVPANGRTLGDPGAPVKIVEWGDYQ